MRKKIVLVAETCQGGVNTSVPELKGFAVELGFIEQEIVMLVSGNGVRETGTILAQETGVDVIVIDDISLEYGDSYILSRELSRIMNTTGAEYACFIHTMRSSHIAGQASGEMGAKCITSVDSVSEKPELSFRRSVCNGKVIMDIPAGGVSFVTILPGSFPAANNWAGLSGIVIDCGLTGNYVSPFSDMTTKESVHSSRGLEEADVIIAAGRGIGTEKNLDIIRQTASIFLKSDVGGSRGICDIGWLPFSHQVGVTGRQVSPSLYMACGISGSQQHVSGIKGARLVVSVNSDPDAAIFSYSDFGVVEDLSIFLPLFIQRYRGKMIEITSS